ncbi:hypothetical protein N9H56_02885 [Pseudomonadales bacterium]|nr:hypothetical protein [Pseudomonadales bacterium]
MTRPTHHNALVQIGFRVVPLVMRSSMQFLRDQMMEGQAPGLPTTDARDVRLKVGFARAKKAFRRQSSLHRDTLLGHNAAFLRQILTYTVIKARKIA